ncbi:MAG: hypothetical protein A2798_03890 [Candidatus Levybacteria bacterium RIFCSPHIGHO2_01_FULL_37_17]|nr:MAG: hypothetical protein A2798_03890 [Candidatus Levybacteria bacterium RIFCSPHIGHO2_01_FULL_37_17]OGH36609.1 MAG: hypothetical protein A2959_03945 [Candidatus Levybacteria bacterium RIFCSPLOWO2_01_FULL_38_23]
MEDDFSESLITETSRGQGFGRKTNSTRGYFLFLLFFLVFAAIFLRVFFLQIVKGEYFRVLSDQNRTKTVSIHAERGIIMDRNGIPLVFNEPGYRMTKEGKTIQLSHQEALAFLTKESNKLEVDSLRRYAYGEDLAHVLGYIGQISAEELKEPAFTEHKGSDVIGKEGIERSYEQRLKGIDGKKLIEVDSSGRQLRALGQDEPIAGDNITLTIDLELQQKTFEAMEDVKKGAAIVSSAGGGILALVSKPSFDPNLFTMGESYKSATTSGYQNIEQVLLDSTAQPLLNRAISGVYPPGSTFKIVVASAALKDKVIDASYSIEDTGILHVGSFSFSNWYFTGYGKTDGQVNVVKGIKRSNDIFFYRLAELLGVEKIAKDASKFFLGKKLGVDLIGEASGTLPNEQWKKENIGEGWYLGDTYHLGIGQGYLLSTPLQVNAWTQAITNEGILKRPHLLKEKKEETISKGLLDKKSYELVRQGMVESCAQGGVAWPLFDFKVKNSKLKIDGKNFLEVKGASGSADMRQVVIACKTGTAEHGDTKGIPHAWITLFAPAYNPEIVVTILAEESGEGSNVAAPIAKKILEAYFGE